MVIKTLKKWIGPKESHLTSICLQETSICLQETSPYQDRAVPKIDMVVLKKIGNNFMFWEWQRLKRIFMVFSRESELAKLSYRKIGDTLGSLNSQHPINYIFRRRARVSELRIFQAQIFILIFSPQIHLT